MLPQAAQDAADIASGKIKNAKGVTVEKANAAYEEAAKAAELAVKRAQEAAGETQEAGKGIWQKAGSIYLRNILWFDLIRQNQIYCDWISTCLLWGYCLVCTSLRPAGKR